MRALIVALALAAGACSKLPSGTPIDATEALKVVNEALKADLQPTVYAVASDCVGPEKPKGLPGFWLDGACRGGLSEPDVGIFIVRVPGSKWSDHFAHELAGHWAILPAKDPDHQGPAFKTGGAVDVARMALWLSGHDAIE